ncbi:sensor histidine kinase [Anaerosporobacter sp.]|uniref:sensor histidine kinase n=1 Tax=Anaerosporobacter sp. TaxID=1872529 RepID=UPI00286F70DC|nr:sensor histidine kinase [Anaerosporobacter sp.]
MGEIIKKKNTSVQGPLSEIAENLLKDTKKEKNSLLISIHEVQTNIDILQKNILTYHKEQLDKSSDRFKVGLGREDCECKIMEEKLKSDLSIVEELQKCYNKTLSKEQDLIRLNDYIKNSCICDSNDFLGGVNEDVNGLKLLETQEIERKRIARELHDSPVQNLTTLIHKTELCTRLVDLDPIRAKLELQTMIGTIKTTINDMRNIIYDLRPMSLEDLGLVITVKRYIKQFIDSTTMKVILNVENERKVKSDIIDLTLFRIIQEACNNAVKHADASVIHIDLIYQEEGIELVIEDNGCGVDNNAKREAKNEADKSLSGFGLSMMKERVGLLSGKIDIRSVINEGTKISVYVPTN